jgi:hypothetical protein
MQPKSQMLTVIFEELGNHCQISGVTTVFGKNSANNFLLITAKIFILLPQL